MPTEINFNNLNRVDRTFKYGYSFLNEINQDIASDLPSVIANAINTEVFKNEDLPPKESIKKICNDINSIFDCMDIGVKFIGLSKDEDTKPLFKDSIGNEFDIEGLSSGEKQLFIRALCLKFLNANNSIILIDEPEISLHPQWQRKIIKVYENIGQDNQLIIATHSPHVVADIKSEQLRVIRKNENGVSIVPNEQIEETYFQTSESIMR
jgi:AAA15 family ATPase/GTPase